MLKLIRLSNVILVESVEIPFTPGLNILTGETGSGKSAILHALGLVAGERSDAGIIRRGANKAIAEAVFEGPIEPIVYHLLEEADIELTQGEPITIRRELTSNGKSRAFINDQQVPLTLLRTLSPHLLEITAQHANQKLFSLESHRDLVDVFGDLKPHVETFSAHWKEENSLRKQLEELINGETERLREIDLCRLELEELGTITVKPGEEEALFAEFTRLTHSQELIEHVSRLCQALNSDKSSILTQLHRHQTTFEQVLRIDPDLADSFKAYQDAFIELEEVSQTLTRYLGHQENSPERLEEINERLKLLDRIKRRYNIPLEGIDAHRNGLKARLSQLESADLRIDELRLQLKTLEERSNASAQILSKKRSDSSKALALEIEKELQSLNMAKAKFSCSLEKQARSVKGDDRIEFFLLPNVGELQIPVRGAASGGELSRLMLALQTLLAHKAGTPTLIFDEIDANIGGATAAVVGEKLRALGEAHQVICITHFPQVARHAHHHLQISKQEQEGRTVSVIKVLAAAQRKAELARMEGNKG